MRVVKEERDRDLLGFDESNKRLISEMNSEIE